MFFRAETKNLDDMYSQFHSDLMAGDINAIKEKLKKCPALATYEKKELMPPVIAAIHQIHHSYTHQNATIVLDILSEYKANFNATHTYLHHHLEVNPLGWLLLNGGDSRLIKKLVDCGTDKNHSSVDKVKKFVRAYKQNAGFTYSTPCHENPDECSPYQLVSKL